MAVESTHRRALVISPEVPYPAHGGGPLRTASLIEYLRRRGLVDLILFAEETIDPPLPPGVESFVIRLPRHSHRVIPKIARNARRLMQRIPPLVDRFSGFGDRIERLLGSRRYDVALVEHFWAAPYGDILRKFAPRVVCDLHNVESELLRQTAPMFTGIAARWERELLPRFDTVLVASRADAARVATPSIVYPNAIPARKIPTVEREFDIAMSGNFDFSPNRQGVAWFAREVWPELRRRFPALVWRLIGKSSEAVMSDIQRDPRIVATGAVDDAVWEIARCRVAVVPLLAGSGTRLKVLEAWAADTAVVSTTLGAEGLEVIDGKELLIADRPMRFINAVSRLLQEEAVAAELRAAGRVLLEREYIWPRVWERLDDSRAL